MLLSSENTAGIIQIHHQSVNIESLIDLYTYEHSINNKSLYREFISISPFLTEYKAISIHRSTLKFVPLSMVEQNPCSLLRLLSQKIDYAILVAAEPLEPLIMTNLVTFLRSRFPLILSFGDIHHKWNPYLYVAETTTALRPDIIVTSSSPHVVALTASIAGIPYSLTPLSYKKGYFQSSSFSRLELITYMGAEKSPFHPRRTYLVGKAAESCLPIRIKPFQHPLKWYREITQTDIHLTCSLNSQFSETFFAPYMFGRIVIVDNELIANPFIPPFGESLEGIFTYNFSDLISSLTDAIKEAEHFLGIHCFKPLERRTILNSFNNIDECVFVDYFSDEMSECYNYYMNIAAVYKVFRLASSEAICVLSCIMDVVQELHRVLLSSVKLTIKTLSNYQEGIRLLFAPYKLFDLEIVIEECDSESKYLSVISELIISSKNSAIAILPSIKCPGNLRHLWRDFTSLIAAVIDLNHDFFPFEQRFYGNIIGRPQTCL